MNQTIISGGSRDARGGYKVDVNRGQRIGRVSSEWFSRPDDERFLSLTDLFASVKGRAERSHTRTVESAAIRVEASRDNAECRCTFSVHGFLPNDGTTIEMLSTLACQTVPNADCLVEIPDPNDIVVLPAQIVRGIVEAIDIPANGVRRLTLSTNKPVKYEAGQYFEVTWSPEIIRMYSAASLPTDPNLVFDIQLHHHGRASEHVASSLKLGDTVRIRGPLGAVYLRRNSDAPIICISNNTGIGCLIAFLRTISIAEMRNPIYIYAGFMMSEYIYGEQELRKVAKTLKDVRRCCTIVGGGTLRRTDRLGLLPEIISNDFDDLTDFRIYAFGSPHAIDVTCRLLRAKGIAPERLHAEPFHFASN